MAAIACSSGDDDEARQQACRDADEVAAEILRQADIDGIVEGPCVPENRTGLSAEREAQYAAACARYTSLAAQCRG